MASALFDLVCDLVHDEMGLLGSFSWGGIFAGSGFLALVRCAIFSRAGGLDVNVGTLGSTYGATNFRFGENNGSLEFFFSLSSTLGAGTSCG